MHCCSLCCDCRGCTKLHPADLTKLLTLYLEFSKIEPEKFSLDNKVTASRKASAELPIKLSLRASEFSGAGSVVKGNNIIITLVMGEDLPELVTYRLQS